MKNPPFTPARFFRIFVFFMTLPLVHSAEVKVILQGGQSNALGRAANSGLSTTPVNLQLPQADVFFYHGATPSAPAAFTTLRPGTGRNLTEFGPEVTFGRAIADASPDDKYAIIKYAVGNTSLHKDWHPQNGNVYATFRDTVTAGLAALQAAGHTPRIVGMVWHQGETDANDKQHDAYRANLTRFIADIRSRYGANLPFLIGEIRWDHPKNGPEFKVIAETQSAIAAADPHSVFIPANDLTFSDRYHFNAAGAMTLGRRFASAYLSLPSATD